MCRRSSCPVGGGGLIAGIASYVKALRPDVRMIGVEPYEADAMFQSMAAGRTRSRSIASASSPTASRCGRSASHVSDRPQTVDEIVRVSNDEICAAIKEIFDDTRTIMEPAGALGVAGPAAVGRADRHAAAQRWRPS